MPLCSKPRNKGKYVVAREISISGNVVFRAYQVGVDAGDHPVGKEDVVWRGNSIRQAVAEERRLNKYTPIIQSCPLEFRVFAED